MPGIFYIGRDKGELKAAAENMISYGENFYGRKKAGKAGTYGEDVLLGQ